MGLGRHLANTGTSARSDWTLSSARTASGPPSPAWAVSKRRARRRFGFEEAIDRLRAHRLAFDPARGEAVVRYADVPADGHSWRYAVIAGTDAVKTVGPGSAPRCGLVLPVDRSERLLPRCERSRSQGR